MLQRDLREQHPLTEAPVVLRPVSQGRGQACHASDADGTSAEKGATIIQISHNVNVSHARSPTSRATREGVSTKQRGTDLRDRKREECTPEQAERQAGCWGCVPGHRGLFPPMSAHGDVGQDLWRGCWGQNDGKKWKQPGSGKTRGSTAMIFQDLRTL